MWTITKDLLDDYDNGTVGPRTATLTAQEIIDHPESVKFRMYDADDELYYEGFAVLSPSATGFEPLDDFGSPNAGCTRIDYYENGRWSQL